MLILSSGCLPRAAGSGFTGIFLPWTNMIPLQAILASCPGQALTRAPPTHILQATAIGAILALETVTLGPTHACHRPSYRTWRDKLVIQHPRPPPRPPNATVRNRTRSASPPAAVVGCPLAVSSRRERKHNQRLSVASPRRGSPRERRCETCSCDGGGGATSPIVGRFLPSWFGRAVFVRRMKPVWGLGGRLFRATAGCPAVTSPCQRVSSADVAERSFLAVLKYD